MQLYSYIALLYNFEPLCERFNLKLPKIKITSQSILNVYFISNKIPNTLNLFNIIGRACENIASQNCGCHFYIPGCVVRL